MAARPVQLKKKLTREGDRFEYFVICMKCPFRAHAVYPYWAALYAHRHAEYERSRTKNANEG
jgi:hypothetical protein